MNVVLHICINQFNIRSAQKKSSFTKYHIISSNNGIWASTNVYIYCADVMYIKNERTKRTQINSWWFCWHLHKSHLIIIYVYSYICHFSTDQHLHRVDCCCGERTWALHVRKRKKKSRQQLASPKYICICMRAPRIFDSRHGSLKHIHIYIVIIVIKTYICGSTLHFLSPVSIAIHLTVQRMSLAHLRSRCCNMHIFICIHTRAQFQKPTVACSDLFLSLSLSSSTHLWSFRVCMSTAVWSQMFNSNK